MHFFTTPDNSSFIKRICVRIIGPFHAIVDVERAGKGSWEITSQDHEVTLTTSIITDNALREADIYNEPVRRENVKVTLVSEEREIVAIHFSKDVGPSIRFMVEFVESLDNYNPQTWVTLWANL